MIMKTPHFNLILKNQLRCFAKRKEETFANKHFPIAKCRPLNVDKNRVRERDSSMQRITLICTKIKETNTLNKKNQQIRNLFTYTQLYSFAIGRVKSC